MILHHLSQQKRQYELGLPWFYTDLHNKNDNISWDFNDFTPNSETETKILAGTSMLLQTKSENPQKMTKMTKMTGLAPGAARPRTKHKDGRTKKKDARTKKKTDNQKKSSTPKRQS